MRMGFGNIAGYDIDIDIAAAAHDLVQRGTEQFVLPAGMGRFADDDPAHVPAARVGYDFFAHPLAAQYRGFRAEAFRKPHVVAQLFYVAFRGPDP